MVAISHDIFDIIAKILIFPSMSQTFFIVKSTVIAHTYSLAFIIVKLINLKNQNPGHLSIYHEQILQQPAVANVWGLRYIYS